MTWADALLFICEAAQEKALIHYISSSETLFLGEVEVNASVFVLSWCVRWALPPFCWWWTRLKKKPQLYCVTFFNTSLHLSLIVNNNRLLIILLICCWHDGSTQALWRWGKGMCRWAKPWRVRVPSCWGSRACARPHL